MILMNDFKAEPSGLREAMLNAANRVFESGWFVLGNEVCAFEQKWAATCGLAYGVGVGNGMDAIEIGLRAIDIGPGDEVITTPMTAFATVLAILRAGATPVLADIDPPTALMSIDSAARCLTPATKAVVLVHLYGQVRAMDEWTAFCAKHHVTLIEDCAQAHQSSWHGKVAGSFGAVGAYSFYPTKNLGALGDAGMLVTGDEMLARRAGWLRNYGQRDRYHHPVLGLNSRLDELHAAILTERLRWLPVFNERRRQIANAYRMGIRNPRVLCLVEPEEPLAHVYHLFVVTCDQRDALQSYLRKHLVQSLIHYPIPVHAQEPCREIARDPLGLANSERHAATCLSLPCHPQMSDNDIVAVIAAVNAFQGS
jgi:dTDP-4-amino-4,6-dideoxygalactose transaminase